MCARTNLKDVKGDEEDTLGKAKTKNKINGAENGISRMSLRAAGKLSDIYPIFRKASDQFRNLVKKYNRIT